MVSVDKNDNILGYLSCQCDRSVNKISSIGAINFYELNCIFSKDFYTYLSNIFIKHNFNKIEWCVVIGNPAEKMYDKLVQKYNGRIVGINHESTKLEDGRLCDVKEYELFQRDYIKSMRKEN